MRSRIPLAHINGKGGPLPEQQIWPMGRALLAE
jgi:hypothetical protein